MGIDIEKKLDNAGYQMFGKNDKTEELILDILKTKNNRYLKAIPFLIYKYKISASSIGRLSKDDLFNSILDITIKIFREFNIIGIIPEDIKGKKSKLNYKEFRDEFELQLRNDSKPNLLIDKQKIYEERNMQMDLSILFTKKEKQIIKRMIDDKAISRTDYEYYSRKTKKKIKSILGLHEFALSFYSKTPKYDEELYLLKRELEDRIEGDSKILDFFLSEGNIFINFTNWGSESHKELKLSQIKDSKTLELIKKYKNHDFR